MDRDGGIEPIAAASVLDVEAASSQECCFTQLFRIVLRRLDIKKWGDAAMNPLNFRASTDDDLRPLTGKSWQEWCDLLDAWEADTKNLSTIALHLTKHCGLRRLYAQMIAVYYKRAWRSPQYNP
jgi:hypothetical protein